MISDGHPYPFYPEVPPSPGVERYERDWFSLKEFDNWMHGS